MADSKKTHPLVSALVVLAIVFVFARIYGDYVRRTEPDREQYPRWLQVMESWYLVKGSSLADEVEREERARAREVARRERIEAARPRRELSVRTPTAAAAAHPLAKALTQAAEEASLPEVVVLGVDCDEDEGREGFCIAWGQGTSTDRELHALMGTRSFGKHRGSVAEWAVSAVHWGSDWGGEPAFFALGIHERKDDAPLRRVFNARSRILRVAHEAGMPGFEALTAEDGSTVGDAAATP